MRNSLSEDMDEFGKVGVEMSHLQSQMHSDYDSAESTADSDLGELRKMLASPLKMQSREDCESSRMPIAPGKLAALLQERGVSATRTQADLMLSCDKRLLLDTWNTSGLQENVFANQFFYV